MKRYYYIDTENIGTGWLNLLDELESDSVLTLFYTLHLH